MALPASGIIIRPYVEPQYDEDIPEDFLCPITKELMREPMTVDCGEGHCFEREAIQDWLNRNHNCPEDREQCARISPNRHLKNAIQDWHKNHLIFEIEPEQLAQYILDPVTVPHDVNEHPNERMGAYLRFVQSTNKTKDVAAQVNQIVKGQEAEIPNLKGQERPKTFQKGAWVILKDILNEARSEARGPMSPRTSRMVEYMRSSEASLRDSLTQSRAETAAMRERIDSLLQRQDEAEAQRRAAEVASSRGPSKLEVGQAILGVVSGVAATAIGRGFGGVMDADPSTTFFSEASSVNQLDLLGAGLQAARVFWAYRNSDGRLVRRLNERFSENLFASVAAGTASYYSTITSTERRIERAADKSEIESLKKDSIAKQKAIDDVTEVGNKLLEKSAADSAMIARLVQKVDDVTKLAQKAADDAAAKKAADDAAAKKAADDAAKAGKFCIIS